MLYPYYLLGHVDLGFITPVFQSFGTVPVLKQYLIMLYNTSTHTGFLKIPAGILSKIVSEYDQEIPQPQPAWHREEEPLNHHETPGRKIKQSNQLSLPHQDDYNTRMNIK